jgi:hypothetical protein
MLKKLSVLFLTAIMMIAMSIPVMAATGAGTENWIDANGITAEPQNSRDVRNNTNGFGTGSYTPISYKGKVTLYAQNYGYNSGDNYDIKLFIAKGSGYTQVGKLYGKGDKLQVEVFSGHSITLVWQRHQMNNRYYAVQLSGPIARTYVKDFKGKDTGYTSGNIYVQYNGAGSVITPPAQVKPLKIAVFRAGWSNTYKIGQTISLAARGEGGTAPYKYQFYVLRSNGSRVNFRKTPVSSNIYPWTPVTPDTYTLGVDVYDATGHKVTQQKTITVLPK